MTVERALRLVAGLFVAASVGLGVWVSPWFLAFTAFVGLNLFQSGFTDWCPMTWLLEKAGLERAGPSCSAAATAPASAARH
jgi:hypothetical protein